MSYRVISGIKPKLFTYELEDLENALFAAIKPDIDEATNDYWRKVENGKKEITPQQLQMKNLCSALLAIAIP